MNVGHGGGRWDSKVTPRPRPLQQSLPLTMVKTCNLLLTSVAKVEDVSDAIKVFNLLTLS